MEADGSIVYQGKRFEGAQAAYIVSALGARVAQETGQPLDGVTPEEGKALLAYRLARDGIPYHVWTRWTFDQLVLYFEGRRLHIEMSNRVARQIGADCKAGGHESPIRVNVPLIE